MSLLTIVENAADEVGLGSPASVIGSSDTVAKRSLRYAIRTGRELVKKPIAYLYKEATFSTVADQQSYSFASDMGVTDFDHFVPFTNWNRTTRRRAFPIQPNEWQLFTSRLVSVSINDRFRIRGADGDLFLEPTPTSVETVSFEYVSENYCETSGGTGQNVWSNDTDVGVIDEEIFELGIIWRMLNRLGQPYAEEKSEYQRCLNKIS